MRIPRFVASFSSTLLANAAANKDPGPGAGRPCSCYIDASLKLDSRNYRHLCSVLRRKHGDLLEIIDSDTGQKYLAELLHPTQQKIVVRIVRELASAAAENNNRLHLVFGAAKPSISDFVVEKAVELGIASIDVFSGVRSQTNTAQLSRRLARWLRIIEAAQKQSGASAPELNVYASLEACFSARHPLASTTDPEDVHRAMPGLREWRILLSAPGDNALNSSLLNLQSLVLTQYSQTAEDLAPVAESNHMGLLENNGQGADSYLVIGPEGGLCADEIELAHRYHYLPVSLGSNTLRSETAAIVGCALVQLLGAA